MKIPPPQASFAVQGRWGSDGRPAPSQQLAARRRGPQPALPAIIAHAARGGRADPGPAQPRGPPWQPPRPPAPIARPPRPAPISPGQAQQILPLWAPAPGRAACARPCPALIARLPLADSPWLFKSAPLLALPWAAARAAGLTPGPALQPSCARSGSATAGAPTVPSASSHTVGGPRLLGRHPFKDPPLTGQAALQAPTSCAPCSATPGADAGPDRPAGAAGACSPPWTPGCRYKTQLCHSFEKTGACPFGELQVGAGRPTLCCLWPPQSPRLLLPPPPSPARR